MVNTVGISKAPVCNTVFDVCVGLVEEFKMVRFSQSIDEAREIAARFQLVRDYSTRSGML